MSGLPGVPCGDDSGLCGGSTPAPTPVVPQEVAIPEQRHPHSISSTEGLDDFRVLQRRLQVAVLSDDATAEEVACSAGVFSRADLNHDGVISFSEFVKMQMNVEGLSRSAVCVRYLLTLKADPNEMFEFTDAEVRAEKKSKADSVALASKKFTGTVLAVAVMKPRRDIVRVLVEGGANVESPYSFLAGSQQVAWLGGVIYMPIRNGDLDTMTLLVELKARLDVQSTIAGKPGATLIWQAAYMNQIGVIKYLLDRKADMEIAAAFQDNISVSYTPLHMAAFCGKTLAVKMLIERGADVNCSHEDDGVTKTPLIDAIEKCHPDIVRLLVATGADVFSDHVFDALFGNYNVLIISSVAQGLVGGILAHQGKGKAPMTVRHLQKFLKTSGDAPVHILNSIFVKRTIMYWEYGKVFKQATSSEESEFLHSKTLRRAEVKTAHMWDGGHDGGMNVATGPHWSTFDRLMKQIKAIEGTRRANKKLAGSSLEDNERMEEENEGYRARLLKDNLVPQLPGQSSSMVDIFQCVLPDIHRSPNVFFALAQTPNEVAFETYGCRAIISMLWNESRRFWIFNLVANTVSAALFASLIWCLNDTDSKKKVEVNAPWRWAVLVPTILSWAQPAMHEVLQFIGCWQFNKLCSYWLRSVSNLLDVARLIMSLMVIIILCIDWKPLHDYGYGIKIVFALTVMLRWFRVLSCLRGFSFIGPRMLPIMSATADVLPFSVVVLFPFLGFANAYYALGYVGITRSFFFSWQMSFLGDLQLDGMENALDPDLAWDSEDRFRNWFLVRMLMVVTSVFLTIIAMNIFIGVLGNSYTEAHVVRQRLFVREQAQMLCDYMAAQHAWKSFMKVMHMQRSTEVQPLSAEYLWFCVPQSNQAPATGGPVQGPPEEVSAFDIMNQKMAKMERTTKQTEERLKRIEQVTSQMAQYMEQHLQGGSVPIPPAGGALGVAEEWC